MKIKTPEKDKIYAYWAHNQTGQAICEMVDEKLNKTNFTFCEVGCETLGLSDLILHEFDGANVVSIDITNCNPNKVLELNEKFPERFKFILESSLTSYTQFPDDHFDLVYIDTDPHKYDQLKQEIALWISKVKTGGILAFHDYDHPWHPDVKQCVDEYCKENNKELFIKSYYNVYLIK
jgi:predicted O-methyltransferase YrrM